MSVVTAHPDQDKVLLLGPQGVTYASLSIDEADLLKRSIELATDHLRCEEQRRNRRRQAE